MNEQDLRERIGITVEPLLAPRIGKLFSVAALDIRLGDEQIYRGGYGLDATPDMFFDLGELTELFTATALLRLVDSGRLWIDTPVTVLLPDAHEELTFYHLLTHTSGLPAHCDLGIYADYDARIAAIEAAVPDSPVGASVQYSPYDLMQVGLALEVLTDLPLEQAMALLVLQPLELRCQFEPLSKLVDVAPTHAHLHREPLDANARRLDGVAGHAGLFGTAADVSALAQVYCDQGAYADGELFGTEIVREALRDHKDRQGFVWALDGQTHRCAGGTGVALRMDVERGLIVSLLTNAVFLDDSAAIRGEVAALAQELQMAVAALIDEG